MDQGPLPSLRPEVLSTLSVFADVPVGHKLESRLLTAYKQDRDPAKILLVYRGNRVPALPVCGLWLTALSCC